MSQKSIEKHLPLTEATFYILLALSSPQHGYAVMQEVEAISQGTVHLAPGTLYGAFSSLEESKLISLAGRDGRRKIYRVTALGREVLREQIHRFQIMLENAVAKKEIWAAEAAKESQS